jgi:pilus assembly protein CpaB
LKVKKSIIILAVILGLLTMGTLYYYIETLNQAPVVEDDLTDVVVAVSSIPAHVKITQEMVILKSLPTEAVHPDAATKLEDIVGYTTKTEIYSEEQVLKSKIATDLSQSNLAYRIPENMRAITIPTDEISGVGGYLAKGDRVDILVTYNDATINPGLLTITQFQNIEILEVGPLSFTEAGQPAVNRGVTSSLTLLVTPSQAEVMFYATINGAMQMTLRNPVDNTINALTQFSTADFPTWRER